MKEGHIGNRECCVLLGVVVGSVSHESVASGASRNRSTARCARIEVCSLAISPLFVGRSRDALVFKSYFDLVFNARSSEIQCVRW